MTRHKKNPLRPLTEPERQQLVQIGRSTRTPARQVERARILLAVAAGKDYTEAARSVGRKSGDAVSQLVQRFNREGLAALTPRHGGGFRTCYGEVERERILREVRRTPKRAVDGTATWSLKTLQRALRVAADGLPTISQGTILKVLHEAGFRFQKNGSWCETGVVLRKRKGTVVGVIDPETEGKKN
jgi:transposase